MKPSAQFSRWSRRVLLAGFAVLFVAVGPAFSQNAPLGRRYPAIGSYWSWRDFYGPTDAISNRIRAQADWVRSVGESAVAHAQGREVRADAYRTEIANSVEYARAYWDKKEIYRAAKLRTYTAPLDAAERRNSKEWRRLKDFPELNDAAIVNGNALNFLLDRLSSGILATQYAQSNADQSLNQRLTLTPETFAKLRVREDIPGGKGMVFQVSSGETLDTERWPFALRDDHFQKQREAFEKARAALAAAAPSDQKAVNDCMKALLKSHYELDNQFYSYYSKERRTESGGKNFGQFLTSKRFLQSLAGEISRMQELGSTGSHEDSGRFQGDNLIALVTHMSRRGLEFAPARQGDEAAYHETFFVMRDLYRTVEEDDLAGK